MAEPRGDGEGALHISASEVDDVLVVRIEGELDAATAPGFRRQLLELVEGRTNRVILELENLELIDSSGLGALVGIQKRLVQRGGELELRRLRPGPRRVFDITGLDQVFTLLD